MRITRALPLLFAALTFIGCGSSSSKSADARPPDASAGPDAGPPDAAPQVNHLDKVCGATACADGNSCIGLPMFGSATNGWCTPNCSPQNNAICTTGYMGPAGGTPVCALSSAQGQPPDGCIVICTGDAQCAAGMKCQTLPAPNAAMKACAPPPP